jgi:hypothetical protein
MIHALLWFKLDSLSPNAKQLQRGRQGGAAHEPASDALEWWMLLCTPLVKTTYLPAVPPSPCLS